jgi:hypothetical protein
VATTEIDWRHEPVAPVPPDHIGMTSYHGPLPAGDADTTPGFPGAGPQAYLVSHGIDVEPLRTHFHRVDQFQIFDRGRGRIGREEVALGHVHYADAFTPYGPLAPVAPEGMGYVTLRARAETGIYYMPDRRDRLRQALDEGPRPPAERRNLAFDLRPPADGGDVAVVPAGSWSDVEVAGDGLRVAVADVAAGDPVETPEVGGDGAFLVVLSANLRASPSATDDQQRTFGGGMAEVGWVPGSIAWLARGSRGAASAAPHAVRLALLQLPTPPAP